MGKCLVCGEKATTISDGLGVCLKCIRGKREQALEITRRVHAKSRGVFGLPPEPPKDVEGLPCGVCVNDCIIGEGNCGFCGLVWNVGGRLIRFGGTAEKVFWSGIMMVCQLTVLVGGFVRVVQEAAIQNTHTNQRLSMALRILRL
jgi:pyruvate formate lyase activating enzyme